MKKPFRSAITNILVLAVTALVFYLLFTRIDFFAVLDVLLASNPLWLVVALLLSLLSVAVTTKRWQTLLKTLGYAFRYKESLYLILGSLPLSSITPAKAGDVIKAYYLKDKVPSVKTIGAVVAERTFDVFSLVLLSLIGMLFRQRYELASIAFIMLVCIIVIFVLARFTTRFRLPLIKDLWNERIQDLILSLRLLTGSKTAFSTVLSYSLLIWFISIAQTLTFFYAVGLDIPLAVTLANVPIAIFIGLIPVTLGGMGTRDAAIIFLFSEFASPEQLLGVGILFSIFRYWLLSLIGIPFMRKMMSKTG
ncbi:MAG: lysylphosphatidylglycerol synthase transmembrane domain-containing protein [Dehalococcoidales bacterium]|nr:lysylphosphatidylglycerol synthase transmembrane domain-containing protein [Dehalococcoidales bacterium]